LSVTRDRSVQAEAGWVAALHLNDELLDARARVVLEEGRVRVEGATETRERKKEIVGCGHLQTNQKDGDTCFDESRSDWQ